MNAEVSHGEARCAQGHGWQTTRKVTRQRRKPRPGTRRFEYEYATTFEPSCCPECGNPPMGKQGVFTEDYESH